MIILGTCTLTNFLVGVHVPGICRPAERRCEDLACCEVVCSVDPLCCDTEWDQPCADQAANSCEFCDPCDPEDRPVNDDCADAIPVTLSAGQEVSHTGNSTCASNTCDALSPTLGVWLGQASQTRKMSLSRHRGEFGDGLVPSTAGGKRIVEDVCKRNEGHFGLLVACQMHAPNQTTHITKHLAMIHETPERLSPVRRQYLLMKGTM